MKYPTPFIIAALFYSTAAAAPDAVIRVYDAVGNVIETHEHKAISRCGKKWLKLSRERIAP